MSDKQPLQLSPREIETLSFAWQCFESDPKIDYDKMAQIGGWANGPSARAFLAKIKQKMKANAGNAAGGATSSGPATPKKTPNRKKRAADGEESPTKKPRATPKSKAKAKGKKEIDDDVDDEFADVKIKNEEVTGVNHDFHEFIKQRSAGNGVNGHDGPDPMLDQGEGGMDN